MIATILNASGNEANGEWHHLPTNGNAPLLCGLGALLRPGGLVLLAFALVELRRAVGEALVEGEVAEAERVCGCCHGR